MDMGAGMVVVMALMMAVMVGLAGAGMWAAKRHRRSEIGSLDERPDTRQGSERER